MFSFKIPSLCFFFSLIAFTFTILYILLYKLSGSENAGEIFLFLSFIMGITALAAGFTELYHKTGNRKFIFYGMLVGIIVLVVFFYRQPMVVQMIICEITGGCD